MRNQLISFAKYLGLAGLVWLVAVLVSPGALIAARGDALQGSIGDSDYSSPPASLKVIWTPDYTVVPAVQRASSSGPVAETTIVHVAFPVPPNVRGVPTVTNFCAHEEAAHIPDFTDADSMPMTAMWNSICGDPDPTTPNAPPMLYADYEWPAAAHNGNYDVSVVIHYTTATDPEDESTYVDNPLPLKITVDVENVLITSTTPANPTPILWDPAQASTVDLSCSVTAAYKAEHAVTLSVFDSQQNPVWQQQLPVVIGGDADGDVTFTWDGTNNQFQNDNPPAPQPKGVYLFKFEVGDTGNFSFGDYDTDKSPYLTISNTASKIVSNDYPSPVDHVQGTCVLNDSAQPLQDATAADLTIYDPKLLVVGSTSLSSAVTNAPNASPTAPVTFTTTMQFSDPGMYLYLFAAEDGDAAQDKGHRDRFALQKNNAPIFPLSIGFQFENYPVPPPLGTSPYCDWAAKKLAGPLADGTGYDPKVLTNQPADDTALGNLTQAAIVDYFSHGGEWVNGHGIHSYMTFWTGSSWTCLVQNTAAETAIRKVWAAKGIANPDKVPLICLNDPNGTPKVPAGVVFGKMVFALLEGCHTALSPDDVDPDGWGSPTHGFVLKGAASALGFTESIYTHTIAPKENINTDPKTPANGDYGAEEWHQLFWWRCCHEADTIAEAAHFASSKVFASKHLNSALIVGNSDQLIEPARYNQAP